MRGKPDDVPNEPFKAIWHSHDGRPCDVVTGSICSIRLDYRPRQLLYGLVGYWAFSGDGYQVQAHKHMTVIKTVAALVIMFLVCYLLSVFYAMCLLAYKIWGDSCKRK
jgi:hypothetical protein